MEVELQVLNNKPIVGDYKEFYIVDNQLHILMVNGQKLILSKRITNPERLLEYDPLASI